MKRRCGIAEQRRRDLGLGELGDVSHRLLPDELWSRSDINGLLIPIMAMF